MGVYEYTSNERPVLVGPGQTVEIDTVIDLNQSRPPFLVRGTPDKPAVLRINSAYRPPGEVHDLPDDPGLGSTFDGEFMPRLQIGFSQHDFNRALVAAMGTVVIEIGSIVCDTAVNLTADYDSAYGVGSVVRIGDAGGCRFGVLATGQQDFDCDIGHIVLNLYGNDEGPGHAFYANESRRSSDSEFLRLLGCRVRVRASRGVGMAVGVGGDHVTAKFKGSVGVDYECLDDQNPCGAFDQYGASGTVKVKYAHPGGDAMNKSFAAFRCGGQNTFGPVQGNFFVRDSSFDVSLAPDQSVPAFRVETVRAGFTETTVNGGELGVVWPGCNVTGLTKTKGSSE